MGSAKQFSLICLVLLPGLLLPACSGFSLFSSRADKPQQPAELKDAGTKSDPVMPPEKPVGLTGSITALEQRIVLLETKIEGLEKQMAGQKPLAYTIEYSDPAVLYKKARALLLEKDISHARQLFEAFAQQHPGHGLADNALYWLGECHYTTGEYKQAVEVFTDLINRYPKAQKVPDALLKTGYAYMSLDDTAKARLYLKQVIKKHPFSPAAEKAQIKLKALQ